MREIDELMKRVARLEAKVERVQLRDLPPASRPRVIAIIGGQTISTVGCIQYSADDPTLTQQYDVNVDTVYPTGLGNAWLMDSRGQQAFRVFVRHDFAGATGPLIGGWFYQVRGTKDITIASGTHMGEVITAYTVTWQV